jgi:DNA-binding MarR family transcriptional regulator
VDRPLTSYLSQLLVAFTIELDNEFEQRTAHRTTRGSAAGSRGGPWLVSLVMWSNLMRFVDEPGVGVRELSEQGGNLAGMERWGYVVVEPNPADPRPKPPRRDWVVRPTARGRRAQEVWRALFEVIEDRWGRRFGDEEIAALRESLVALVGRLDLQLPEYLPVLGYGLRAKLPKDGPMQPALAGGVVSRPPLSALLSQVLLAFTIEFELESELSLAISANVMRLLGGEGVRVRDLPRISGVSKEAIAMAVGFLERGGYAAVEPDPTASRVKVVRLTPKGRATGDADRRLLDDVEKRWRARFGDGAITALRAALERLVGEPTAALSPLFRGLEAPAGGWRASVRRPETLPHHPMVLHRGGYPDGS